MTFRFLLSEGLASIRRVASASTIGAILTGISLAIVGGFLLVALAYRTELSRARASANVEVFLDDRIDSAAAAAVAGQIAGYSNVAAVHLRTRAEAQKLFGDNLEGDSALFEGGLPLPNTIQVELVSESRTSEEMKAFGDRLLGMGGVMEVAFPDELVRVVEERSKVFVRLALAIGAILSLSVVGVTANTAQLTVASRRSVIRTMHLLGAERRWVLAPFVIQGLIIGFTGGLLATLLMYGSWLLFPELAPLLRSNDLAYLPLLFPLVGMVLGTVGSGMASGYYIRRG